MWRASLRDLQWRLRRFLIGVIATALVLAMTLLTAGASEGIHTQDSRAIESFGGDVWFVAEGASGPFTTATPIAASAADDIARVPGVERASAVLFSRSTVDDGSPHDVNIVALPPGGLGSPRLASGREVRAPGEIVVDSELHIAAGTSVRVGAAQATVVGTANDVTFFLGTKTVYALLQDTQQQLLGGLPLATAVVAKGVPRNDVPGLTRLSPDQVRADITRPTKNADQTIQFINVLLWIVAAGIIGSIVYLSALERSRDFAVMKATGVASRSLLYGLILQSVILSSASALLAAVLAQLLTPGFSYEVTIATSTYVALVVVSLVIGLAASAAGLRRALRVEPAMAFGGG